jgi:hypothetical protein
MKKIFGALKRYVVNSDYQNAALKQYDRLTKGEKVLPPRYPSEIKHTAHQPPVDPSVKQDLETRHDTLIDNANQMNVIATAPIEHRASTSRPLPTIESELLYSDRESYMYGFYEPSPESIPRNRLTLHEAIDLMQAKIEIKFNGANAADAERLLASADAVARVDRTHLERMFTYFMPFERAREPRLVPTEELDAAFREAIGADDIYARIESNKKFERQAAYERSMAAIDDAFEADARRIEAERDAELRRKLESVDSDSETVDAPKRLDSAENR